jgi:hypothetical protein
MTASQQHLRQFAHDAVVHAVVGGLAGWLLAALAKFLIPQAFNSTDSMLCVNFSILLGLLLWLSRVNQRCDSGTSRGAEPGSIEMPFERPLPTRNFSERLARYLQSHCRDHLPYEASVSRMSFHSHELNCTSHPPKARWWIRLLLVRIHNNLST